MLNLIVCIALREKGPMINYDVLALYNIQPLGHPCWEEGPLLSKWYSVDKWQEAAQELQKCFRLRCTGQP